MILLIVYINIIIFSAFQHRQIFYFIYFDSTFFYHLIWNVFMCGYFSNQSVAVAERKKSYLDKKWRILLFHRQKQALSGNNVFFLFFKNVYEVSWECQWIFDDIINSVYMVILNNLTKTQFIKEKNFLLMFLCEIFIQAEGFYFFFVITWYCFKNNIRTGW